MALRIKNRRRVACAITARSALFLDLDGTLLDIAPRPDTVVVPTILVPLLVQLVTKLDGAVAIVSGRPLTEIDTFTAPLRLTAAGEHGAVIRMPDGHLDVAGPDDAVPAEWRLNLEEAARRWPGVLVEPKAFGVAVHFRQAPELATRVRALVDSVVHERPQDFEVMPAAMAFEIRSRRMSKARPVAALMSVPPFQGRTPVFVGDDVTDHDGFRAVEELDGFGVDVGEAFDGKPAAVLHWLSLAVSEDGRP